MFYWIVLSNMLDCLCFLLNIYKIFDYDIVFHPKIHNPCIFNIRF